MAENYSLGIQRIWYKSEGFVEGLQVIVDFLLPSMGFDDNVLMVEFGNGFYYLDYEFSMVGMYAATFYENGIRKSAQAYNVRKDIIAGGNKGLNVIG